MKDGIRVFLTGDGADEVFAGYNYSIPYVIADILSQGKERKLLITTSMIFCQEAKFTKPQSKY